MPYSTDFISTLSTKVLVVALLIFLISCGKSSNEQSNKEQPTVIILDDKALEILDPSAELEKLSCGFKWTEGPLWIEEGRYLIFSDIPRNTIFKYDSTGETTIYLTPSGFTGDSTSAYETGSNGLLLDNSGQLVLLQHGDRRVARMLSSLDDPQPDFETIARVYEGKRLNSPNDGVMDSHGNIYFTDPTYGLAGGDEDPTRELDFHGVFCAMATGELKLIDKTFRPNGIALSPEEDRLYVSVSTPENPRWYVYPISAPGRVGEPQLFFSTDTIPGSQNAPDGMHVTKDGLIFTSGPGGAWLLSSEGQALARIDVPSLVSNCTLDTTEEYLYLTASDCLLRLKLKNRY